MSLESIIDRAKRTGVNCIFMTDHERTFPYSYVEIFEREGILLVPCAEFTSAEGVHIIALWPDDESYSRKPAAQMVKMLKAKGCGIVIPHPYKRETGLVRNGVIGQQDVETVLTEADFIEALNGGIDSPSENNIPDVYTLGSKYNLRLLASSDAHTEWHFGVCTTVLPVAPTLWDSLSSCHRELQVLQPLFREKPERSAISSWFREFRYSPFYQTTIHLVPSKLKRGVRLMLYRYKLRRFTSSERNIHYKHITIYETN